MKERKPALLTQGEPDVMFQDLPSTPNKKTLRQGKLGEMGGSFDHGRKSFEQFAC